ncbi:MAG: hypothetical protein K0B01_07470 [Syntrophobacterales bacterium]|nr:hypothetical protein [Syntrophobacterales bacterium]
MPVLHKYKDKGEYYIKTAIRGNIITFHLTPDGKDKILKAGITPEQPFRRAILLDLYRSGEVFTYGSGPGEVIDDRQTELDFSNDPDSEKMFPSCASCSSIQDLHLVEIKDKDHRASILCGGCRSKKIATFDTSIPLALVSRAILNRVIAMKEINQIDASVTTYKELLDAEFKSKWDAYRKGKPVQGVMDIDTGNQGELI